MQVPELELAKNVPCESLLAEPFAEAGAAFFAQFQ
jgi:hypothetical protein